MTTYQTGLDLRNDVLFRSGEPASTSSDYATKAMEFINRAYRALASGASEFLPEYIDDWWWLRGTDVLTLDPVYSTGTISVTKGSTSATLTDAPSYSLTGWRIKIGTHPEIYKVAAHTASSTSVTLDYEFVRDTDSAAEFKAMHTEYDLSSSVQALISPMIGFDSNYRIGGMTEEALDRVYPIGRLQTGLPKAFALVDEATVRFSHGGPTDGLKRRIEYRFRPTITDLQANSSEPLVPLQYRHCLADMACTLLLIDKNDDRATAMRSAASAGLAAMVKENRRRLAKVDPDLAMIFPRMGHLRSRAFKVGYTADDYPYGI